MDRTLITDDFIPIEGIVQAGVNDCNEVWGLALEARHFLEQLQDLFPHILQGWLFAGFAHLGVFLFEVTASSGSTQFVWVVAGDVPPAFIEARFKTGLGALKVYVRFMREWVEAVRAGKPVDDLIPVCFRGTIRPAPQTLETAEQLSGRLDYIEQEVIPAWSNR
ncbi:MAG TPA: hypothetical protein VHE55_07795 [Fimbriimonadaceae bacterium]|nr:hypothetical protein [Fimbriimonadaceae bacterium]